LAKIRQTYERMGFLGIGGFIDTFFGFFDDGAQNTSIACLSNNFKTENQDIPIKVFNTFPNKHVL
jgi:hypothetical protein